MRNIALVLPFAALLAAQSAPPPPVLGTVTQFKVTQSHADPFEIGVKPDDGEAVFVKFGPDTQVVRVPPGERGLEKAEPAKVTDILVRDRVLVSFVAGMEEARRIVVISADDIARRNEAERLDWEKRGISGLVAANNGNEITLQIRTFQGAHTVTVAITPHTRVRRYAPDSVKFTDAQPGYAAAIAAGDQFRARGVKSEDGTRLTAEDVVFGTFLTRLGRITAVHPEASQIEIEDLATKKPLAIKLAADSQLKILPDMRAIFNHAPGDGHGGADATPATHPGVAPAGPPDILRMLQSLPPATIENLKVGGGVFVTSTRGLDDGQVTAIMLLANADSLIQIAQKAATQNGGSAMDVISGLHGGMFAGPGGLSLPAMLP